MSIIYDALKKVEASRSKTLELKIDKEVKSRFKTYLIYVLVGCFGLFVANIFYRLFTKPLKSTSPQPPSSELAASQPAASERIPPEPALATPAAKEEESSALPSLVLSGVFFSEDGAYALINNQIVREGDIIDGATIKQINLDGVELEVEGSTIKLSYVR